MQTHALGRNRPGDPTTTQDQGENGAPAAQLRGSNSKRHRSSPTPTCGIATTVSPNRNAGKPCRTNAGGPSRLRNLCGVRPRRQAPKCPFAGARGRCASASGGPPTSRKRPSQTAPRRTCTGPCIARGSLTSSHPAPRRPAGTILARRPEWPAAVSGPARQRDRSAARGVHRQWCATRPPATRGRLDPGSTRRSPRAGSSPARQGFGQWQGLAPLAGSRLLARHRVMASGATVRCRRHRPGQRRRRARKAARIVVGWVIDPVDRRTVRYSRSRPGATSSNGRNKPNMAGFDQRGHAGEAARRTTGQDPHHHRFNLVATMVTEQQMRNPFGDAFLQQHVDSGRCALVRPTPGRGRDRAHMQLSAAQAESRQTAQREIGLGRGFRA